MKYQIIGKNITVTEGIHDALVKKLSKLDKFFKDDDDVNCRAVVRSYKKNEAKVEVTISTKDTAFRAEVKDRDLYDAFDKAVDKLAGQMRKFKTQLKKRYEHEGIGKAIIFEELEEEKADSEALKPVRFKEIHLKPTTIEDAILEMEQIGHDFYLYLDTDEEKMGVVYKRQDGGYGLLMADRKIEIK